MASRFRFNIRDAIMILILGFITAIVIINRSQFRTCKRPLEWWLIVDCGAILIFRTTQFAFEWFLSEPDPARRSVRIPKVLASIHLSILYPFLVLWTAIGTVWFVQSWDCLDESSRSVAGRTPFICFLIFSYLHVIAFGLLIWSAKRRITYAQLAAQPRSAAWRLAQMQTLLMHMQQGQNYGLNNENNGLSEPQISAIPTRIVQAGDATDTCSICVSDLVVGDIIPNLPCRHIFHASCLKPWLLQNKLCPNCRAQIVPPSVPSAASSPV